MLIYIVTFFNLKGEETKKDCLLINKNKQTNKKDYYLIMFKVIVLFYFFAKWGERERGREISLSIKNLKTEILSLNN